MRNKLIFWLADLNLFLLGKKEPLLSWAAHGRKGVVSAATGTGKSRVGVAAILESINERPVVLLSHRLAIKGQWKRMNSPLYRAR